MPSPASRKVERARARRREKQLDLYTFLGGACRRCGESHPGALSIHHTDPATKRLSFRGKGWGEGDIDEAFMLELASCELLCMNCHGIHHWENG